MSNKRIPSPITQQARKSYTETVEGMVKKRKDERRGKNYFNTFVLLNDAEYLRRNPRWRSPLAFCIYCANIDIEPTFPELHSQTFIPYEGARELRHGVCRICKQNTSNE